MKIINTNINTEGNTQEKPKKIALVGFQSSGKSTIFRLLTDFRGDTAFSTTVDIKSLEAKVNGKLYQIFDLPGIPSLNSMQKMEKVAINTILNGDIDIIINVVDSAIISRGLKLTIELIELGLPTILVMNFSDEARQRGIKLDKAKMAEALNIPVVLMNARAGKGLNELIQHIEKLSNSSNYTPNQLNYTLHIEKYVEEVENLLEKYTIGKKFHRRFYAIKLLEDQNFFTENLNEEIRSKLNEIENSVYNSHKISLFETISYERHHIAMKLAEEAAPLSRDNKIPIQDKIDSFLTHPIYGYLSLIGLLVVFFVLIFYIGTLLSYLFDTPLNYITTIYEPLRHKNTFIWYSINGAYQGILGAFGIVLPYFLPLVFFSSILEEAGYMSRLVLLLDDLMHKIGLHGKSIIPFILGLGCSVPALYSTRLLENRRDRLLTAILILFIPCSARLTVIFAISAAFTGPIWTIIILLYIVLIIIISSSFLSKILPESPGLMMEITPLRAPSLKISLQKTWIKVSEFLREALLFLVLGGVVLGWIEYFNLARYINVIFSPIVKGLMQLPEQLGSTLLFGFLRAEFILVMATQALGVDTLSKLPLNIKQAVILIIFVALNFPCLSTFIVFLKEYKWKITLLSSIATLFIAIFSAFLFRILLNLIY
jgi:ferrous iron transport protein B